MQVTGTRGKGQEESLPPDSMLRTGLVSVSDNVGIGQQLDGCRVARLFGHLFGHELAVATRERAGKRG
jgi:hypothetical protein